MNNVKAIEKILEFTQDVSRFINIEVYEERGYIMFIVSFGGISYENTIIIQNIETEKKLTDYIKAIVQDCVGASLRKAFGENMFKEVEFL